MNSRVSFSFCVMSLIVLGGCKKDSEAPFVPKDKLTYHVAYSNGLERVEYDLDVHFKEGADGLAVDFSARPKKEGGPSSLNNQSVGDKAVIKFPHAGDELRVGQLYLPKGALKKGAMTPSGRLQRQQPHGRHQDAWAVSGASNLLQGTRFYDPRSGVLVGWNIGNTTAELTSPMPAGAP